MTNTAQGHGDFGDDAGDLDDGQRDGDGGADAGAVDREDGDAERPTTRSGDVISYSYLVTNNGNVTLSGPFTVSDDKATDRACPATPTSLAPGASDHLHGQLHASPRPTWMRARSTNTARAHGDRHDAGRPTATRDGDGGADAGAVDGEDGDPSDLRRGRAT